LGNIELAGKLGEGPLVGSALGALDPLLLGEPVRRPMRA